MDPEYREALEAAEERLNELAAQLESLQTDGLPTAEPHRMDAPERRFGEERFFWLEWATAIESKQSSNQ